MRWLVRVGVLVVMGLVAYQVRARQIELATLSGEFAEQERELHRAETDIEDVDGEVAASAAALRALDAHLTAIEREYPGGIPADEYGAYRKLVRERNEAARDYNAVVERHRTQGLPAPENSRAEDRREFEEVALDLLTHLRRAFDGSLTAEQRAAVTQAERSASAGRERLLAAQAALARELPDYWQRLERHAAAFPAEGGADARGWLGRLFPGGANRAGRNRAG